MKRAPALVLILLCFAVIAPCRASAADSGEQIYRQAVQALKQGENDKAIELMSRAIALNPEEYRYYNDRGVAYKRAGKLHPALLDYTRALAIKPGFAKALNNRGVAFISQGNYRGAIKDLTRALKHGELKSKIYTNRGLAYARLGQHHKAIADFRKALSFRPIDHRTYLFMGESLANLGENEKALKMYKRAEHVVKNPKTLEMLGKRISALEKLRTSRKPETVNAVKSLRGTKGKANPAERAHSGKRLTTRDRRPQRTEPRRPRAFAYAGQPKESKPKPPIPTGIASVAALDKISRKKAVATFSPGAAEMYRIGRKFLAKSDTRKALIRYEDALQLAKRNRNAPGAAWSLLEIGRVYAAIGDHLRAARDIKKALRVFEQLDATDESILALIELASAYQATGLGQSAAAYASRARELALARGHFKVAGALAAFKQKKAPKAKPPVSAFKPEQAVQKKKATPDAANSRPSGHLDGVGLGPAHQYRFKVTKPVPPVGKTAPVRRPTTSTPVARAVKRQPTKEKPHAVNAEPRRPKSIADHQADLRKFKESGDEVNMIVVLERLADTYARRKNLEKVDQCLTASLALREKRGLTKGMERLLLRRGRTREQLGKPVLAIEDYTRSLVLSGAKGKLAKSLRAKITKLAKRLGLNPNAVLASMQALWKARQSGNAEAETPVFYQIGRMYEKAGKVADALNYYRKATASMAAQEALLLEKIGKTSAAEQSQAEAMGAFKKLDYSRYLQMMNKKGKTDTFSRRYPIRPASNGRGQQ